MARRITVKKILSSIPNITKLTGFSDVNDSGLSETNGFLRYDSDNDNFKFVSLASLGVQSVNSITGAVTITGASGVSVNTSGDTITLTGAVDSASVNTLIDAADTHDSAAVQSQIDSNLNALDTHDSAAVQGQITSTINASYIQPLARAAISAGNNVTYDSATGVIGTVGTDSATVVSIADSRISAASIGDLSNVDLAGIADGRILKYNSSSGKFVIAADATDSGGGVSTADLVVIDSSAFGSLSYNGGSGVFSYVGVDSDDIKTVTNIPYSNLTGTPTIPTVDSATIRPLARAAIVAGTNITYDSATGVISSTDTGIDSAAINTLIAAADTHDSAAVEGQIDSAYIQPLARAAIVQGNNITYDSSTGIISAVIGDTQHDSDAVQAQIDSSLGVLDTHDSGAVLGQINETVNRQYIVNAIEFQDDDFLKFGDDSDFTIVHNGSHTVLLDKGDGSLFIEGSQIHLASQNNGNPIFLTAGSDDGVKIFDSTGDLRLHSTDAGVSVFTGLKLDGNDVLTTASTINADTLDTINSTSFLRSDVKDQKTAGSLVMNDGVAIKFGTDSDHTIKETSGNLEINTSGAGLFKINTAGLRVHNEAGTENQILATENNGVTLYFDGNQKAVTRSDGFEVTGHLITDSIQTTHIDIFGEITNRPSSVNVGGTQTTVKSLAHNNVASSITYSIHMKDINGTTTKGETSFTTVICTLDSDLNTAFTEFGTIFTGDSSFGSFIVEADATNIDLKFTRRSTRDGAIRVAAAKTVVI